MKRLSLCLLLFPLLAGAQQFNIDIIPASTGLKLGHSNQRWDAFLRNVNISGTCFINGVPCGQGTGGGGSMTWPAGSAGIPNYSGSNSWGTSYSASNKIPNTFLGTFVSGSNGFLTGAFNNYPAGTANQITVTLSSNTPTLSIPSAFTAPGSITSTTSITTGTNLILPSSGLTVWNSDSGVSRSAANSFAFGNGTQGDTSATLNAAIVNAGTKVVVGATDVPCGASCFGVVEASTAGTPTTGEDYCRADSTSHGWKCSNNNGAEFVSAMNLATSSLPTLVATGTSAMGTGAISSGTCATVVTTSATGTVSTDTILATPNTDPTGVTGYAVSASGSLYIQAYPTTNNVNFKVCNNTSGSLTPSALTLNWRVIR